MIVKFAVLPDVHILNDKTFSVKSYNKFTYYLNLLKELLLDIEATPIKFTSFSRTMHWLIARQTVELLRREKLIAPDMWPPNSPDIKTG